MELHGMLPVLTSQLKFDLGCLIKHYVSMPVVQQSYPMGWPDSKEFMQLVFMACSTYAAFGDIDVAFNTLDILLDVFDIYSKTGRYLSYQGLGTFCRTGVEIGLCYAFVGDVEGAEESLNRALSLSHVLDFTESFDRLGGCSLEEQLKIVQAAGCLCANRGCSKPCHRPDPWLLHEDSKLIWSAAT